MPDLSSLLRDHADSLDVETPDPASVLTAWRYRRRRRRGAVAAFIAAGVIIGVPTVAHVTQRPAVPATAPVVPTAAIVTPSDGRTVTSSEVAVVRTDPDGQGLVVPYSGGCQQQALQTEDTPGGLDVELLTTALPTNWACSDDLVIIDGVPPGLASATVSVRLESPLGSRALTSNGHTLIPFDGSSLLIPADAARTGMAGETGRAEEISPGVWRTRQWTRVGVRSNPTGTVDSCTSTRVSYSLTQTIDRQEDEPGAADDDWTELPERSPLGTVMRSRNGTVGTPIAVRFDNGDGMVQLNLLSGCSDQTDGVAVLVTIAQGLRPAA